MFISNLRHMVALTCLAFAGATQASSFDCAAAVSKTEKAICSDAQISELDDKLATLWHSTLAKVANAKTLKTDQRQWLKNRNACGDSAACLRRAYLMRLAELEHAAQPFSWHATWQLIPPSASTSATVITQRDDATHISFDITAAEAGNSGDLTGIAELKDGKAVFVQDDCILVFTPVNGVLDISQGEAGGYCSAGLGVYYTGRFVAAQQPLTLDYDLLSLGLARTPLEDQALRSLLGEDYQTLIEKSGSLISADASKEIPGNEVTEMSMRGLGATGVVMGASDARYWVLLVANHNGHSRLRYYTNVSQWKNRLPDALQTWYDRMKDHLQLPVDFMP
ncbi:hypothetical protein J3P75_10800 [Pseudomonas sp. R1-1]|uniref:lysozyme inhibitor LprI family protein n=1 Tax=Pseudomonas sp. R1-1 TaxID=1602529 RepID=UPI003DA9AF27